MKKVCETCKWYETYTGACCNGDSDYCADYVSSMNSCENWEGGKMLKNVECPYCHVREDRQVVETGQVSVGKPMRMYKFKCDGCGKAFWKHEKVQR